MDQAQQKLIRENYLDLVELIKSHVDGVCLHLWSAMIISDSMKEKILEQNTIDRKKAEALLTLIMKSGPDAFDALYRAVIHAEVFTAAKILKPDQDPFDWEMLIKEENKPRV